MEKKPKASKFLWISLIIGVLYIGYSISYWTGAATAPGSTSETIGAGIATAVVMPHLICSALAVMFNIFAVFGKSRGFALTCAILYTVALVLFPPYFMFVILEMIFAYIGYARTPKRNQ